jgi:unsaturated rhamnogalacturonyl hydrolase
MKLTTLAILLISAIACTAQQPVVTLDYHFNHEYHTTKSGKTERFHYTWEDTLSSGYSTWGSIFKKNGARLDTLAAAPTADNLKSTDVYIIVDPDTKKETADPNYIETPDIKAIAAWVKAGGVLVLLANDSANTELEHLNHLSETFGIHFNSDIRNKVTGNQFDMGAFIVPKGNAIFKAGEKIYVKEICTLKLSGSAMPAFTDGGDVIIATAKYGKGTVFAVGDPWFYNEYCNGRLPAGYDNDKAAGDLAEWLLKQVPLKK